MTTSHTILDMLKGCDSRKPMPLDTLLTKCGIDHDQLLDLLDVMFQTIPAQINCAEITRGGKTQKVYWPTGVIEAPMTGHAGREFLRQNWKINRTAAEGAIKAAKPAQLTKETPPMDTPKTKTSIILEMLADRQKVSARELCIAAETQSVAPFVKVHMKRGQILRTEETVAGSILAYYSIAPGETLATLQTDHRKHNIPPHLQKLQPLEKPAASNVHELKRPETPKPANEPKILDVIVSQQIYVDTDGQLTILLPGAGRVVFPAIDTRNIKHYLTAVDLDALTAAH